METIFLLLVLVALLAIFGGVIWWMLKQYFAQRHKASVEQVVYQIRLPKEDETKIDAAEQMFSAFHGLREEHHWSLLTPPDVLGFSIVARSRRIEFFVFAPKEHSEFIEKQIHGAYPEAEIKMVDEPNVFTGAGNVAFTTLKFRNKSFFPIKRYKDLPTDPLNAITSTMSKLEDGEAMIFQLLITPKDNSWRHAARAFLTNLENNVDEKGNPKVKIDPAVPPAVEEKSSKVGFTAAIQLLAVSRDMTAANARLGQLVGAFDQFALPHLGSFRRANPRIKQWFMEDFLYRYLPMRGGMVLNIEELATIFHFPNKDVTTPYIEHVLAKTAAAPQNLPTEGLYLGKSQYRGEERSVFVLDDDRRRHMYVIGQTGTGKSEFLKFMVQQDIKAGRGVAFIDPHGEAVEDILKMIPPERMDDVIYFNPSDLERPLGLNILEAPNPQHRNLIVNAFIGLLYKLYDPNHTGIMGPMLERAVRNVMLTAMEEEGNSLVEVMRLLTDPEFQKQKIEKIKDPMVKRYWTDEIANTSDFHKSEKLGYFVSKFDRFVTDSTMRNIIGQPYSAFDFRKVMDQRKILLVNLSKGLIGEENSNFLGLILVPRLLIAAMSRADVDESQRPDFYLYVDEFQNFATEDFAQILSEARKYHLSLTVGNQFIGQIEEKIKDAVFGNVGTLVSFRIGQDDADYLAHQFEPVFSASDLINNTIGNAATRLLVKGQPTAPFSLATDWPAMQAVPRDAERAQHIKELSRQRYGIDRNEVEAEIRRRAQLE
jgi:hypothetical protein